jgi:hypothetical protein
MLMQELFSRGIMKMGASRNDPSRQVGVFNREFVAKCQHGAAEIEKFWWIIGSWNHENEVPATSVSPSYTDIGSSNFCLKDNCICIVAADGREIRQITFDPFSRQWIYVLTEGSYGILRSSEGWVGNQIVFAGLMTMIGINCEWRMTWAKRGDDRFSFVNEERSQDGSWLYIDEWRFTRKG